MSPPPGLATAACPADLFCGRGTRSPCRRRSATGRPRFTRVPAPPPAQLAAVAATLLQRPAVARMLARPPSPRFAAVRVTIAHRHAEARARVQRCGGSGLAADASATKYYYRVTSTTPLRTLVQFAVGWRTRVGLDYPELKENSCSIISNADWNGFHHHVAYALRPRLPRPRGRIPPART